MVQCDDIWLDHPVHAGKDRAILRGISCTITAGLTVIVGPSGGGKSSLLRLLNRLNDPDGGRVLLDGQDVQQMPVQQLRRRVGLVAQKPIMYAGSVWHNLCQPLSYTKAKPPAIDSEQIRQLCTLCDLEAGWLPMEALSLSGGQQQRVSLARTLIHQPDILLLDEPTSALDRPTALQLMQRLKQKVDKGGFSIIMVTHDLALAQRCADQVIFLARGQVLEQGRAEQVLVRPRSEVIARFIADPESGFAS